MKYFPALEFPAGARKYPCDGNYPLSFQALDFHAPIIPISEGCREIKVNEIKYMDFLAFSPPKGGMFPCREIPLEAKR